MIERSGALDLLVLRNMLQRMCLRVLGVDENLAMASFASEFMKGVHGGLNEPEVQLEYITVFERRGRKDRFLIGVKSGEVDDILVIPTGSGQFPVVAEGEFNSLLQYLKRGGKGGDTIFMGFRADEDDFEQFRNVIELAEMSIDASREDE